MSFTSKVDSDNIGMIYFLRERDDHNMCTHRNLIKNINVQAVFVDRDGTIGGTGHFIHPKDFHCFPYTEKALKILKDHKIKIFAFTNQHRISRGEVTLEEFIEHFKSLGFDHALICPHAQDSDCTCGKPSPGMLLKAAADYNLDLTKCIVIGDVGSTDMIAAEKAGCHKILVRTGWGEESLGKFRHTWVDVEPDYIADNLLEAVYWIVNNPNFYQYDLP